MPEKYVYSLAIWPAHGSNFSDGLHEYLKMMPMADMEMTEAEFEVFRYELKLDGFELHEVSRWPYHVPEPVICL